MKLHITFKNIQACHPSHKTYSTDSYYQRLANRLYDHLQQRFDNGAMQEDELPNISLALIRYFEDIVADSGLWRAFSRLCEQELGYTVPLYHDPEEYYPDEPSLNAIRFLTWKTMSDMHPDQMIYADDKMLLDIGQEAYSLLDAEFENAPVNDELSRDTDALLDSADTDFNRLRQTLTVLTTSYLMDHRSTQENILKIINSFGDKKELSTELKEYHARMSFLFNHKLSPLALPAYLWLKALAEVRGKEQLATHLGAIKVEKQDTWRITARTEKDISIESLHGHTLTVPVEELNLDEKQLARHDGLMGSFVFYQEAWHLNGLLVSMHLNGRFEEMRSQCRDIPQEGTRSYSSEELKQMFGGKTLIYTKDSNEMKKLLQKKMKYSQTVDLNQLNSDKPVTLFIDDKDTYYNQFFSFDTAPCIKDATNPYYNPKQAQAEAIDMLWDEERCTTHMAEYLVEHDMLPDAYHQPEFRPAVSASQQKADLLFFMRYHRSKNV